MLKIFFATLLSCFAFTVNGQFDVFERKMEYYDSINTIDGREKLFVHYDKPQYNLNDTIWMKGYIVSALSHEVNDSSHIAYIELIDGYGELIKRVSTVCEIGMFYSNIKLTDKLFSQGEYTLRAYTNRMRNYGDSLFFQSSFKVINSKTDMWRMTINEVKFSDNKLMASLMLKNENQKALADSKVQVSFLSNKKVVFRKNMITGKDGSLYLDTLIKDGFKKGDLQLIIANKNLQQQIPVMNGNAANDVQFLPEGGALIAGKKQQVGFKALNILGKGLDISGVVKDSKDKVITSFKTIHKGMGSLWITPAANESYTAYLDDGSAYKLPAIKTNGSLLQTSFNTKADSVIIKIDVGEDNENRVYYLSGAVRGAYYIKAKLQKRNQYELRFPVTIFPSGVASIILYNENQLPLNEKAVFIWNNDALTIAVKSNKEAYANKENVLLQLSVNNKLSKTSMGSFSIAVVDTSLVNIKADADNIVSYMHLSSDLKGVVEDPGYYIKNPYSAATEALMLTQGWVQYDFANYDKKYNYEKVFTVTGKVSNIVNKPVAHTKIMMFGRDGTKGMFVKDTVTNKEGIFHFDQFPLFVTDSVSSLIKAVNKRDKSFGIEVEVFQKEYPESLTPATNYDVNNILFDTVAKKTVDKRAQLLDQLRRDKSILEEVIVTSRSRIKGSKNLNDGGADLTITESVLSKAPKETLLDVLYKRVPGFNTRGVPRSPKSDYFINANRVIFIFDGIAINWFNLEADLKKESARNISNEDGEQEVNVEENDASIQYANTFLQYYMAEDIAGIEVMKSPAYNTAYKVNFLPPELLMSIDNDFAFIEITTHGGVGPYLKKKPGIYLQKLHAPIVGRKFYSPQYVSTEVESIFPDLRQTIYWNSDVVTNEKGEAKLSFYTSESKGSYLMIIQGTDLKGRFGTLIAPLKIKTD